MSEHDPLCSTGIPPDRECICEPLRQAEQRGAAKWRDSHGMVYSAFQGREDGARLERERVVQRVKALHHPVNYGKMYGLTGDQFDFMVCDECSQMCHSETGLRCDQPADAVWPCAELERTVAAIKGDDACSHEWNWYENEDTGGKARWYCLRCGEDR
jgi:hypothetical protein